MRRGRSKGGEGNKVISLTQFEDEANDASALLIDPNSDVEGQFFADFERGERRKRIDAAFNALTLEQRQILVYSKLKKVPLKEIASNLGISYQSVQDRILVAQKKFQKNF